MRSAVTIGCLIRAARRQLICPRPYLTALSDPRKQIRREFLEPRVLLTGGMALSKA
jgi:hypothetical protein